MWVSPRWRRVDRFLARHRRPILRIAAMQRRDLPGPHLVPAVRFQSAGSAQPKVESVSTLFDLMGNPQTSPNTINVLAPSLAEADALGGAPWHAAQRCPGAYAIELRAGRPGQETGPDRRRQRACWIPPSIPSRSSPRPATPRSGGELASHRGQTADRPRMTRTIQLPPMPAPWPPHWRRWRTGRPANRARATEAVVPGPQDHAAAIVGRAHACPCHAGHPCPPR